MDHFVTILSIVFTFFSGILIIAFNRERKIHKLMLGSILLIFSWYIFIYFAVLNSWIIRFSYLLRIARPFYFATPPLAYLYIKFSVLKKDKLSKKDYLHFIPTFIVFVDVFYYYLTNYELLSSNVHQIVNHVKNGLKIASGFIPGAVILILKASQGIIYAGLIWHLLYSLYKKTLLKELKSPRRRWIVQFSIFITAIHLLIAYNTCQPYFNFLFLAGFDKLNPLLISRILLLMMAVLIFFYPSVIYSTTDIRPQDTTSENNKSKSVLKRSPCLEIHSSRLVEYLERIEELNNDNRFFKSNLSKDELAAYLHIPTWHLTTILNQHYNIRFNDFINGYRIRYVINSSC